MSLLHESTVGPAREAILARVRVMAEEFRMKAWGVDGSQTPASIHRAEAPEEREMITRHFARQNAAEARGDAPGNTAATVMQHPAMQRAAAEQIASEEVPSD